jgi:hypothetical protein
LPTQPPTTPPHRQQDYQHWYPEEVTFQPKLNESAMSREFLRKSLQKEGASINPHASGEERHMALVNRLYASYEKVCMGLTPVGRGFMH